jgi:hypothetical protein
VRERSTWRVPRTPIPDLPGMGICFRGAFTRDVFETCLNRDCFMDCSLEMDSKEGSCRERKPEFPAALS